MFGYEPGVWDSCRRWSGHSCSVLPPSHPEISSRGSACRGALGGAEMGFAWLPEESRQASGDVDLDEDDTSWRYGHGRDRSRPGYRGPLSAPGRGSVSGQAAVLVRHRTRRHAQGKGHLPALARLAVATLPALRRATASPGGVRAASTGDKG